MQARYDRKSVSYVHGSYIKNNGDTVTKHDMTSAAVDSPEYESFVKNRVQVLPVDFGLEFLLPIWQEVQFDIRVAASGHILDGQVPRLEDFHDQSFDLRIVLECEVELSAVLHLDSGGGICRTSSLLLRSIQLGLKQIYLS